MFMLYFYKYENHILNYQKKLL